MSSSSSDNSSPTGASGGHIESLWYPWHVGSDGTALGLGHQQHLLVEDLVRTLLREYKIEHAGEILSLRNEIINLKNEILTLKETNLKLNEEYGKIRPLVDERKRNLLLRRHIPFGFVPEKRPGTSESKHDETK